MDDPPLAISAVPAMIASGQSIFSPPPSLVTIGVRKASRLRARRRSIVVAPTTAIAEIALVGDIGGECSSGETR